MLIFGGLKQRVDLQIPNNLLEISHAYEIGVQQLAKLKQVKHKWIDETDRMYTVFKYVFH